ncbi:hypothetical protein [Flavobacterium franklandianum]|uniref:Uncharacterized protein n=1 Tax=Flavobacterium franklandianum TaxID=2594430 RepID=A0A553CNG9_9FLAO|nr:hypothetical protein [Flavobacterium franklandianum]TRX22072.1 hypothetical protein FNW17_05220 [Flavobacterium franklandianum]
MQISDCRFQIAGSRFTEIICPLFVIPTKEESQQTRAIDENESFVITIKEVEWTCYKKGNYEIKDNILTLKKDNLIQETDSLFTYKYKTDSKKKVLIPLEKGFNTITIKLSNKTP